MIEGHELGSTGVDPQWLMFGVELPVGPLYATERAQGWRYLVVGSSELSRAALVNETAYHRAWEGGLAVRTRFSTNLGSYTMAFGATYTEAIRRLFEEWQPDAEPPPAALPTGDEGT